MMPNDAITFIRLPEDLMDRVDEIAMNNGWTRSHTLLNCLTRYFDLVDHEDQEVAGDD